MVEMNRADEVGGSGGPHEVVVVVGRRPRARPTLSDLEESKWSQTLSSSESIVPVPIVPQLSRLLTDNVSRCFTT